MGRHRVSSSVSLMRWATLLWTLLCSSASALETKPQATYPLPHEAETSVISSNVLQVRADVKPFTLRIMPLGASITAGYGTTFEQGYRKPLRDQLRWRGWPVNMIGSSRGASEVNFKNDQHEGHGGHVVSQTIDDSNLSLYRMPNLILINCGTNDAAGDNVPTTGDRMKLVLDHLYNKVDNVTIILSTLVPRLDESAADTSSISAQYRTLASNYAAAGRKIILAELGSGLFDSSTDYYDKIHPNDKGAAKVAAVWDQAILEAEDRNFITEAIDTGIPDISNGEDSGGQGTCAVVRGGLRGPVKTQSGWGYNDGTYAHKDDSTVGPIDLGHTVIGDIEPGTGGIWFAQLVNPGNADFGDYLDELVYCTDTGPGQVPGPCLMWENSDGNYNKIDAKRLDIGLKCLARGIRFGDVNGDGLDDAICINQEAKMYVAINKGGNPPTFEVLENGGLVRGTGSEQTCDSQAQVRLGDMDGDGRLDYCCIDKKGDIYCWRNGGSGKAPTAKENGYWQELVGGITFKAKGEGEGIDGVRFVDINGDGRTDWVYIHKDGSSDIYVNQRGSYSEDGKGLAPHWAKASSTHAAFGGLDTRDNIYFGRLQPRSSRGDNLPARADRIVVQNLTATAGKNDPKVQLFFQTNLGAGGTKLKGDGVFYCDMFGSGSDDYLWVLSTGAITLFKNIHSPPQWGPLGQIIDIERDRKSIHFGDWDGDGKCDILAVERHTGRVEWWRNLYKTGDKVPTFAAPKWAVDSYDHLCTEGWGNGVYDYGLEFADLDGDKRVDYLCMKKNMQVFGSLNKAGGLQYKDQIKLAPDEGKLDRANFKWADVNGDGKADLIWVDKFNGKGRLWTNGGFTPAASSSMTWNYEGFRFDGYGRGQNIHFPKIGTSGRADYHDVWPDTGISNTWFNECSREGEGQDDYPTPIDPNLPVVGSWASLNPTWQDLTPESVIVTSKGDFTIPYTDHQVYSTLALTGV
ncbi:hypothetical protein P152DRAFT_9677 [Eremomyces bilateralis CBS 781.70]|uniref:SGNH hydrolase-type esterase domain-containing protein n=1 Tax=Eremomyces bilateralis CBS 781.70 TaxID=1392243 RepID=A0A6G1GGL3_9PEZI|nr:uncharacterized protein P152DRAFT_9677 [Eremomyces bilateralis CBS 781.70]KAF1817154.1 hypothetical protein P152DRAFT_9677 [Eremomyces bilateralis CBS 781.70]